MSEARLRPAWILLLEDWAVASLSVESDLDQSLVLAPVFEAVAPAFVVIPSFGVGLGVPVRLKPDAAAGIRGQATVTWGIGAALSVDYFPSDDDWQTTLMAQIGLCADLSEPLVLASFNARRLGRVCGYANPTDDASCD